MPEGSYVSGLCTKCRIQIRGYIPKGAACAYVKCPKCGKSGELHPRDKRL